MIFVEILKMLACHFLQLIYDSFVVTQLLILLSTNLATLPPFYYSETLLIVNLSSFNIID